MNLKKDQSQVLKYYIHVFSFQCVLASQLCQSNPDGAEAELLSRDHRGKHHKTAQALQEVSKMGLVWLPITVIHNLCSVLYSK